MRRGVKAILIRLKHFDTLVAAKYLEGPYFFLKVARSQRFA
jgi:hypothetical protein